MTEVKVLLQEAVDEIERHGWLQGHLEGPGGECCATEAINRAARRHNCGSYTAFDKLRELISGESVAQWNDHPQQTRENVLQTLRMAAEASV